MVDILIKEKKYTEAISIIAGLEQIVADNLDMTYRKIEVYMNSGHQIEALTEINGHYDDLKNDVRIMDLLLSVSLNYKRAVDDKILAHAKEFNNVRVLMLAAETEYIKGNFNEARKLAM